MTYMYDQNWALDAFNRYTGRAATDSITPAVKWNWLAEAQDEVIQEVSTVCPYVLYPKVASPNMPLLLTTDSNVFTFGVDGNGNPITPIGSCQIYRYITDIPDRPMRVNWDYLDEVSQIRLPRGQQWVGPLYYRGIVPPPPIGETQAPGFLPLAANELSVIRAARNFAESGNVRNAALADRMNVRWAQRWPQTLLMWKRQFSQGGALVIWTARDLVTPLL